MTYAEVLLQLAQATMDKDHNTLLRVQHQSTHWLDQDMANAVIEMVNAVMYLIEQGD